MNRQQTWAKSAHEQVTARRVDGQDLEEYRTLCMKLPSLLSQSGLVQGLAFLMARSRSAGAATMLFEDLEKVSGRTQLFEDAKRADMTSYLALTREVIEVATWMRRFAQIELEARREAPNGPTP